MAITQAVANSFKTEVLTATHNFTATTGNTFKIALYTNSATLSKSTTAYTTSNEVSGTGYTAAGNTLTSVTPTLSSDTAVCDFADTSWTSATFTTHGCLIYNTTAVTGFTTNRAVCVVYFGGAKTVSNGTFSIEFPTASTSAAILRITS